MIIIVCIGINIDRREISCSTVIFNFRQSWKLEDGHLSVNGIRNLMLISQSVVCQSSIERKSVADSLLMQTGNKRLSKMVNSFLMGEKPKISQSSTITSNSSNLSLKL